MASTNAPDDNPGALKSLFSFLKIGLIKFLSGPYKVLKAAMPSPDKQLYEFASFMLDAGSRILLKDGTTVRPTPIGPRDPPCIGLQGRPGRRKRPIMKEVCR
jgi:hypothetical protein